MISKGEITSFGIITKICYQFNILPYKWDEETFGITVSKNPFRLFFSSFCRFVSALYLIFSIYRLYPAYIGYKISYPIHYPIYHVLYIVFHTFTVFFDTIIHVYTHEILELYNQLIRINFKLGNKLHGNVFAKRSIREWILKFLIISTPGGSLIIVAQYFFMPKNLNFIFSAIPVAYQTTEVYLLCGLIEILFFIKLVALHLFNIVLNFLYIFSTQWWLKRICIVWPKLLHKNHKNDEELNVIKSGEDIPVYYQTFSVLCRLWLTAFSPWLIPGTKICLFALVILANLFTILFRDRLLEIEFIVMPMYGVVFGLELLLSTFFMSRIYNYSSELGKNALEIWVKRHEDRECFQKVIRGCRPVRCRIGNFYFAHRGTTLTTFDLIINNTITILLSL